MQVASNTKHFEGEGRPLEWEGFVSIRPKSGEKGRGDYSLATPSSNGPGTDHLHTT